MYTDINEKLFRVYDNKNANSSKGILFRSLFELSKAALLEWEKEDNKGLLSEADKNKMINKYFTKEKIREYDELYRSNHIEYISEYNKMHEHLINIMPDSKKLSDVAKEFRHILSKRVIPKSIYEDKQEHIIEIIDEIEEKRKLIGKTKNKDEKQKLRVDILRLKDKFRKFTLNITLYELGNDKDCCVVDNEKVIISTWTYNKEFGILKEKDDSGGIFI